MIRLSITARLALLTVALSLVSTLALAGLVWQQTHDDAMGALRRDTIEQAETFSAVYRSGGENALRQAIADAQQEDDSLVALVADRGGARRYGAGPSRLGFLPAADAFRIGPVGSGDDWGREEAGFTVRQIGKDWLVSGRLLDDWERAQRTIERALLLAVLLSLVLGVVAALVVTRFVTRRIDRIAGAVDAVAAGDLSRRVGVVGAGHDAFDRLASQIDGMLERVDRLMTELRLVTDSIAHDLRSPLARLRSRAEAASRAQDPQQREAALGALVIETDLMMRMLSVLLEISRSEAIPRESLAPQSPAALLEEIADLYAPLVEDAGLAFRVELPDPPPPPRLLHRELLSQALSNLLDNAIRHARGTGEIELALRVSGDVLRLSVADRGHGIAPEDRAQALSRFGRLDSARSLPGAGLGLALVEAVARLHGGTLELGDNAPGLVATMVLPG